MRRSALCSFVVALVSLAAAASAGDVELVNPSFEEPGDGVPGWTMMTGATTGRSAVPNDVAIDREVAHEGRASLRLRGAARTTLWRMFAQPTRVTPGHRVSLRVFARCAGLDQDRAGYKNGNGGLIFKDAAGARLGLHATAVLAGDRDWVELGLDVLAPAGAATMEPFVFASAPGTAWFDDVRLRTAPTEPLDEEARAAAFDALAAHLRRSYSFWGYGEKPGPDELFARHRSKAVAAVDRAAFEDALIAMLGELDDVHIWVDTSRGRRGTSAPALAVAWRLPLALRYLASPVLVHGRNVLAARVKGTEKPTGYLLVASLQLDEADVKRLAESFEKLADTDALILDVRPNGGGNENLAMTIAARFTKEPLVYAGQRWRDATLPAPDGFGPLHERRLEPAPEGQRYGGRVIVLQGPGCVSSTEGLLLMCAALPAVTTVGRPSRGASGNPAAFAVLPGLVVWSSRWRAFDLDGQCIEGRGVAPDVLVEPGSAAERLTRDAAFEKALELLAQ